MTLFDPETQIFLLDGINSIAGFAVNWLLQSTLLIAAGLFVGKLLQSRGSAVQSLVYRTTLVAVLICPLATLGLASAGFSGWSVQMPAAWAMNVAEPTTESVPPAPAMPVEAEQMVTAPTSEAGAARATDGFAFSELPANTNAKGNTFENGNVEPVGAIADIEVQPGEATPFKEPDSPAEPAPTATVGYSINPAGIVACLAGTLWLFIAMVLLCRLLSAWRQLWRLKRDASPVDADLNSICEELSVQMNVSSPQVYLSPFLPSPCLAGLRNPAILLPEGGCKLSMKDVLIHELAHLRRHDCHWNLLRQVATSLFFFQPLLWVLSRRLEFAAEEVCDDFVVQLGGDRTEYANRLVGIAALSSAPIAAAGVGVVSLRSMLAKRVSRILDSSRTLSTRTNNLLLVSVLVCGLLGTSVTGLLGLGSAKPTENNEPSTELFAEDDLVTDDIGDDSGQEARRFTGSVNDPAGQPVDAAQIYFVAYRPQPSGLLAQSCQPVATTDSKGSFDFSLDDFPAYRGLNQGTLVAVKNGFGFVQSPAALFETSGKQLDELREKSESASAHSRAEFQKMLARKGQPLQLVLDEQSLSGRVVDIDGQPVAGVRLTPNEIWATEDNDLSPWREAAADPKADFYSARTKISVFVSPQVCSLINPGVTDKDGKFTIRGIGDGRIAQLLVEGQTIASAKILARTEKGEPVEILRARRAPDMGSFTYHANEFTYIAAPTALITGTVRDMDTKEPIPGVTIKSQTRHGEPISGSGQDFVRAVTDKDGKYRLIGMPIGEDNRIAAIAPDGDAPFLSSVSRASSASPDQPVEVNFDLKQGLWIEGQVTDRSTGKGLPGRLSYQVSPDSPSYKFGRKMYADERDRLRADQQGKFRIAGLPGPAYVTFLADDHQNYARTKFILNADGSREKATQKIINTAQGGLIANNSHAVVKINPEDVETFELNLQLDASGKLIGRAVDPTGMPIEGFYYTGRLQAFGNLVWRRAAKGKVELIGYEKSVGRSVYVVSKDHKLAGSSKIRGQQDSEFTVTLQPAGSVTGRLIDEDGEPIANCRVMSWRPSMSSPMEMMKPQWITPPLPANVDHSSSPYYETDERGHFEIKGLVPGVEYYLQAFGRGGVSKPAEISGPFESSVKVGLGESKDLGDVKLGDGEELKAKLDALSRQATETLPQETRSEKVRGAVVDENGQPLSDATVRVVRSRGVPYQFGMFEHDQIGTVQTDRQGRFEIEVPPAEPIEGVAPGGYGQWQAADFIAIAPGYALNWQSNKDRGDQAITIRLSKTSEPLRGRLVNADGSPAAGVEVAIGGLTNSLSENVKQWLSDESLTKAPENTFANNAGRLLKLHPVFPASVRTDASGEFEFAGIKDMHSVSLAISGQGVVHESITVVNHAMRTFQKNGRAFYGSGFVHSVSQGVAIEGRVTCAETGQPLVGFKVAPSIADSGNSYSNNSPRTKTDSNGRYRLEGLPPNKKSYLRLIPPKGQPYLASRILELPDFNVDASKPVQLDVQLRPGVLVRGRVTDAADGKPVAANVLYFPFKSNDNAEGYHCYKAGMSRGFSPNDGAPTNENGEFEIVAIPGGGILAARCKDSQAWMAGYGADKVSGFNNNSRQFDTYDYCTPSTYNGLAEVDITEDIAEVSQSIQVSRGGSVQLQTVDHLGTALKGVNVRHGTSIFNGAKWVEPSDQIEIAALHPDEKRNVILTQDDKGLGCFITVLAPNEFTPEPVVHQVTLKPFATIKGRLIHESGEPVEGMELTAVGGPTSMWRAHLDSTKTAKDGSFQFKKIVPEGNYQISKQRTFEPASLHLAKDLNVAAGESIDLGTIDITTKTRLEPVRATAAVPANTFQTKPSSEPKDTISGVVIGADMKRVAGAKFYLMAARSYELESESPKLIAKSNEKGEYKFEKPTVNVPADAPASWGYRHNIIVKAPGYGFAWEQPNNLLRQSHESQTLVGNLYDAIAGVKGAIVGLPAAGNPIEGRIVDIDGNGVAGATVRVQWFHEVNGHRPQTERSVKFANMAADEWAPHVESLNNGGGPRPAVEVLPMATTDSEGRFELKDLGHNRLFRLIVQGERIENATILARNQPGEKVTVTSDFNGPGEKHVLHPQNILHVAGPSVPLEGRVVDFDSGQPIANALIRVTSLHGVRKPIRYQGDRYTTRSDDEGKFRITGLPVGNGNRLVCLCPDDEKPYPIMGIRANTSGATDVLKQDVRMKRGVWVKGRVFDKDTDQPMTGSIYAFYFRNPEMEQQLPGIKISGLQWAYWTNLDGYFRIPVLATRGILAYEHHAASHEEAMERPIDKYPRGAGRESIVGIEKQMEAVATWPYYIMADNYRRVVEFDVDSNEESVQIDLPLVASRKIVIKPTWPEGVWVDKYQAYGAAANWGWQSFDTPEFEVKALKPGEERKIFVFNRQKNLVAVTQVSLPDGDAELKIPKLQFQKAGTIVGRLLDADGEPVTDATLGWRYRNSEDPNAGIWAPHPGKNRSPSSIPTDKDGRFRLTGIVPGMKYTASATANRKMYSEMMMPTRIGTAFKNVSVEPGETKDLGDVRLGDDKADDEEADEVKSDKKPDAELTSNAAGK